MKFTDQQKTAALEAAGLTDPIPTQLVKFYNSLLHLDWHFPPHPERCPQIGQGHW